MGKLFRKYSDQMVVVCVLVSLCYAQGERENDLVDQDLDAEAADEAKISSKSYPPGGIGPGLRPPGTLSQGPLLDFGGPLLPVPQHQGPPPPLPPGSLGPAGGPPRPAGQPQQGPFPQGGPIRPPVQPQQQGPVPQGGPIRPPVQPQQQGPFPQGGPIRLVGQPQQQGPPQGGHFGPQIQPQQLGPPPPGAIPLRPVGQTLPLGPPPQQQLGPPSQILVQPNLELGQIDGSLSTGSQAIPTIARPPNYSKKELPEGQKRRVEDTKIKCKKDHMIIIFRFNTPFNGLIYPYNHFRDCIMASGNNQRELSLNLRHGICGDQDKFITRGTLQYRQALIEHALMVQWETDFVCDDDQHFIVRCDRPDDYNKTVAWAYGTRDLQASFEQGQHPGPNMAMEIQYGEGPHAPPVDAQTLVVIGDTLTLVFTLSDRVFWFDSNVLNCVAYDGAENSAVEQNPQATSVGLRRYTGQMLVIENSCSVKPKIFSHFNKEKDTLNGYHTTIHYALFKAFRFPTSNRLRFVCNVQVCYRQCPELPPCSQAFHPRHAVESSRKRRAADDDLPELENAVLVRSIDVSLPEEAGVSVVPGALSSEDPAPEDCYSSTAFFGCIIGFSCALTILLVVIIVMYYKDSRPSFFSPRK